MKKMFKTALLGLTALVVPFAISVGTKADSTYANDIDTSLEYQVSSSGDKIRYISTMVLNNERTLNDIKRIDMTFTISKTGETNKVAKRTTTKVYDNISGDNGKDPADNTYYAIFTIDNASKYNEWTLSSTFTYVFADDTTENATASSWLIGGTRLYYKKTNSDWGNIKAYMWQSSNGSNINKIFPGEDMEYDSVNNVYFYDYLPSKGYDKIIFSDGSNQSDDTFLSNTYNHYLQKDSQAYPVCSYSHTLVSDGANTHSCQICGYSEAHTLTGTTNGDMRTVTCSECGFEHTFDTTTLYYTETRNWAGVNAYRWIEPGDNFEEWPGISTEPVGINQKGQWIYKVSLVKNDKKADRIIFNYGEQTENIILPVNENYNAIYYDFVNKIAYPWLCIEEELDPIPSQQ